MTTTTSPDATYTHAQVERPRRGCLFTIKRVLKWLGIAILGLALVGVVYQLIATEIDKRNFPPPGQMVDVGGFRLHINCIGQGSPAVILENGHLTPSSLWYWVQSNLAGTVRVCAYDRAGGAWSDSGPEPRDARHGAMELHTLLGNAAIEPPYVLAGHSWGGLLIRVYADMYPDEVVGLALVDATHHQEWDRPDVWNIKYRSDIIGTVVTWVGLTRLTVDSAACSGKPCNLPPQPRAEVNAEISNNQFWAGGRAEFASARETFDQASASRLRQGIPLAVVTAYDARNLETSEEDELQAELAQLSSNSIHIVVAGAKHVPLLGMPEYAGQVSDAILRVVEAARTGQPLASR